MVYVHDLGGSRLELLDLMGRLGQRGMASLSFDLVGHGGRATDGLDPAHRIFSADWRATRDALWQSALDLLAVLRFARTGLDPALRAAQGLPEPVIDTTRLRVHGLGLGGIVAMVALPLDPGVERAALSMAGGELAAIFEARGAPALAEAQAELRGLSAPDPRAWTRLRERLRRTLDGADPLLGAREARGLPGGGPPIFLQEAIGDALIPEDSARALWAALGGADRPDRLLRRAYAPGCHRMILLPCDAQAGAQEAVAQEAARFSARRDLLDFLQLGRLR